MGLTRKLQELGKGKYYLNIPNTIVRLRNWKKGDNLKVEINTKGDLVIKK